MAGVCPWLFAAFAFAPFFSRNLAAAYPSSCSACRQAMERGVVSFPVCRCFNVPAALQHQVEDRVGLAFIVCRRYRAFYPRGKGGMFIRKGIVRVGSARQYHFCRLRVHVGKCAGQRGFAGIGVWQSPVTFAYGLQVCACAQQGIHSLHVFYSGAPGRCPSLRQGLEARRRGHCQPAGRRCAWLRTPWQSPVLSSPPGICLPCRIARFPNSRLAVS